METFTIGNQEWEVTKIEMFDASLTRLIEAMVSSGKVPAQYFARKVLKSGKISKQSGLFYKFEKSGRFIKVL